MRYLLLAFTILFFIQCSPTIVEDENLVENLLQQSGEFDYYLENLDKHKIQIIYTRIDRDSTQSPSFRTFYFNHQPDNYFYPASTVKLPASLLALEKVNKLDIEGLNSQTTMHIDSAFSGQSPAYQDSTAENGEPSIAHYIKKILLVSDNDAHNRLYEFLGQGPFNESMHEKGFSDTRMSHRLSIFLSPEENSITNPMRFLVDDSVVYEQQLVRNDESVLAPESIMLGKAHYANGELIENPMEFRYKNNFPLQEQHDLLKSIFFPESVGAIRRFDLTDEDYSFIYKYMSMWPSETTYPDYTELPDNYVKFFMYGDGTRAIDPGIRVFNKVGQAYGFLIDNAYIVDFNKNIEFLISAVIYVNENETLNDGVYEYDSLGFPFFTKLGQTMYDYERENPPAVKPDLSILELN